MRRLDDRHGDPAPVHHARERGHSGQCAGEQQRLPAAQGSRLAQASGTGDGYLPGSGVTIIVPKNNWVLSCAYTCPDGSAGRGGMGVTVTFTFVRPTAAFRFP